MKNPLQTYFDRHGLRMTPWAERHKIAPPVVSRYLSGQTGLSARNARRIARACDNEVTELELLYWEPEGKESAA